jgi:hypothetical protein
MDSIKRYNNYRVSNAKKVNKKRFPNSCIYIIRIKNTNYYKIGVSQNYKRRLRDIESSMPFTIELITIKKVKDAYNIETTLHDTFKQKYIKSEWFNLNELDIKKAKKIINTGTIEVSNSLFNLN